MIPCYGTHGSRQRINNKSIQEEYKMLVLVAEAYDHVVPFRPYRGVKRGKQVASSTKWGLGENVDLGIMEYLISTFSFHIFSDTYFTSFPLLTHLGANNVRATGVLNKIRECTTIGYKKLQEKGTWPLWTAHIKQISSVTLIRTTAGQVT